MEKIKEFIKKNKNAVIIAAVVLGLILVAGAGFNASTESNDTDDSNNTNYNTNTTTTEKVEVEEKDDSYGLNETFKFDELEITIGSSYTFTTLDNQFSDYNGASVIKLPITVKNLSDETHGLNMFYYNIYGSKGTEVENFSAYFDEDCIEYAGDLRSGASYTKYLYIQYDGNGEYVIEFDNWSDKIEVEFEITK